MPLSPVLRSAAALALGGLLVAVPVASGARPAGAQTPPCEQDLPAATDGRFTLDRTTVRPGEDILGLLTDFQQWPAGLVGGGSGETLLSCTPWEPEGRAEVIGNQGAPFVLLPVPATAAPGTYTVSIVFQEGSTVPGPATDGRTARLSAQVTVASQAPRGDGPSPACQMPASAAPTGRLVATAQARPGRGLTVTLTGVASTSLSTMNEYDQLWFVACFAGTATAVAHQPDPPGAFEVEVPLGLEEARYPLRVIGLVDSQVVAWELLVPVATTAPGDLPGTGADGLATALGGLLLLTLGATALHTARR